MTKTGAHGNTIIKGQKTIHFTTAEGKQMKCSGARYSYYSEFDIVNEAGETIHYDSSLYLWFGYSASNCREFKNVTNVYED